MIIERNAPLHFHPTHPVHHHHLMAELSWSFSKSSTSQPATLFSTSEGVKSSNLKEDHLAVLFASVAEDGQSVTKAHFLEVMRYNGIQPTDPRIAQTVANLTPYGDNDELDYRMFAAAVRDNSIMVERILQGSFVLGKFGDFSKDIQSLFEETRKNTGGKVAVYIPQLGRVDPDKFGLVITTIDGQQLALGDADEDYCIQSTSKVRTFVFQISAAY